MSMIENIEADTNWQEIRNIHARKDEIEDALGKEILKMLGEVGQDYWELPIRREIPLATYIAGSNLNATADEAIEDIKLSFLKNLEREGIIHQLWNQTRIGDNAGNDDAVFSSALIRFYPYKLFDYLTNKLPLTRKEQELVKIYYDEQTGDGYFNNKNFRLSIGTPECELFGKLYKKVGQRLDRQDVVDILKKYPKHKSTGLRSTSDGKAIGYAINANVKSLRAKICLSSTQLVQNKGNLVLSAGILAAPPKVPQNPPK